jgi:hypothetical protein
MMQVLLGLFLMLPAIILANQSCVIKNEEDCCHVAFPGIGGTVYAWKWVNVTEGITVNLDKVTSDTEAMGSPNRWFFDICVVVKKESYPDLKFEYKGLGEAIKTQTVELLNG